MRTLIVIPAFNEEENLPSVITDLKKNLIEPDILVVNDGSEDNTSRAASGLGIKVIDLPYNLGIGAAVQTGLRYAWLNNYDFAIQFDGDGQHRADQIMNILKPAMDGEADMVVGSRFLSESAYEATLPRKTGIYFFSSMVSAILGQRITDATSGFRVYNKRAIEFFNSNYPEDYPEVEALILLHKKGLTIKEVPVSMRERTKGKSSITAVEAVYYMIKVALAVGIDLIKKVR